MPIRLLLGELKEVGSLDAAAIWARRILPAKNSLNIVGAAQLENAFQAKLAALASGAESSDSHHPLDQCTRTQSRFSGKDQCLPNLPLTKGSKQAVLPILSCDESVIESI